MPIKQVLTEENMRPVKIWTDECEAPAMEQLKNTARLPFIVGHVAAMPDVHLGIGATVGSVVATSKAIVPAAVGVDLGCGMLAVQLSLNANDLPDDLKTVRHQIERDVPVGFNMHNDRDIRHDAFQNLFPGLEAILNKHPKLGKHQAAKQLGTLGGGNHFIELCLDENQNVWVMLHSGSRGIGNIIGRYFIEKARQNMEKMFINLPDRDLAYLVEDTEDFDDYVEALDWAQDYAMQNRKEMLVLVLAALRRHLPDFHLVDSVVNCHHNYVSRENHFNQNVLVTRKGAIRARTGDLGIIPGSMGAKSFIVRGKGNPESFCSCSHGAGRRMSRNEARKKFSEDDLIAQTEGVECRKDKGVVDEIPGAYKNISDVMNNQSDLVEVVHTLKQILCVKG